MGLGIFISAKSAIHEIAAFSMFIITAIFITGNCIIETINRFKKEIITPKRQE